MTGLDPFAYVPRADYAALARAHGVPTGAVLVLPSDAAKLRDLLTEMPRALHHSACAFDGLAKLLCSSAELFGLASMAALASNHLFALCDTHDDVAEHYRAGLGPDPLHYCTQSED